MKRDGEFIVSEIAGEYIILPTGSAALRFHRLITINEVEAFLWELLAQEQTEESLVQNVLRTYEVDEKTARQDVANWSIRPGSASAVYLVRLWLFMNRESIKKR